MNPLFARPQRPPSRGARCDPPQKRLLQNSTAISTLVGRQFCQLAKSEQRSSPRWQSGTNGSASISTYDRARRRVILDPDKALRSFGSLGPPLNVLQALAPTLDQANETAFEWRPVVRRRVHTLHPLSRVLNLFPLIPADLTEDWL
jgi:hypothetical protein